MSDSNHCIQREIPQRNAPVVALEQAKSGKWTASICEEGTAPVYLHSRYDPVSEADRFAAAQLGSVYEESPDRIVLYGMGCGHHVKALLTQTNDYEVPIEVWETNVPAFLKIEQAGGLTEVMDSPRLTIVVSDELQVFSERMKCWEGSRVHVIVHEPSLRAIPIHLGALKDLLRDYHIRQNSVNAHRELLHSNFERNNCKAWPSVSAFAGMPSVPAILISAGPSLPKTLDLLPLAADHCLLGAVGTAASLLNRYNIKPDFIVMSDPKPGMLKQLEGWNTEEVPLFFLSTLYSEVVERYQGPKFVLFQEGFTPAEKMASFRGEPLVATGGSVATTLFSLARLLGLRPLCMVGQDLAYTDNRTHAEGTPLFHRWEQEAPGERILAFDRQGTVVAPRNLLLYKKWFEEQAEKSNETFYNATEGGAYINGFAHIKFSEYLQSVQMNDASEARATFHRIVRSATQN